MVYLKFFVLSLAIFFVAFGVIDHFYNFSNGLVFLISWSIVALVIYPLDKVNAGSGRSRVPELILLFVAFMGFSVAALFAQIVFNHKLRKPSFNVKFFVSFIVQLGLWFIWFDKDFYYFPLG